VAVAIVLPGFGRLMAFLGSFTTFFICAILPVRGGVCCCCLANTKAYCREIADGRT
jgi:hypothetical protein